VLTFTTPHRQNTFFPDLPGMLEQFLNWVIDGVGGIGGSAWGVRCPSSSNAGGDGCFIEE